MDIGLPVFVVGLAVIAAASLLIVAPLFRPTPAGALSPEGGETERWERQKRQALAAIREAELDHQMGKLSDEDLAGMRARFETQALEAMAALEQTGRRRR
jgi:hypothetical protein